MKSLQILALAALARAQLQRQVLSTFIFTTYGDRTPFALKNASPQLTPLGAQQMFNAGANFRAHYIDALNLSDDDDDLYSSIRGISDYHLRPDQITVMSRDEQYISAGATAFMQGLYPSLETLNNYTYIVGQSSLADGSNLVSPLRGYQYPRMQTIGENDLNHIWLDGSANCPSYTKSGASYFNSDVYKAVQQQTAPFYQSITPGILQGAVDTDDIGYFDAWTVYDYLQYMYVHNQTVADQLSSAELTEAEILATNWVFAMNANTSSSGVEQGDQVGVISGKSVASRVLQAFQNTINTEGREDKMTLLFGSFEPIIAFTALAGLNVQQHTQFLNLPEQGASMVFELFSLANSDFGAYPNRPPLSDFVTSMSRISIASVADWCSTCESYSIFCPAFSSSSPNNPYSSGSNSKNPKLSPAIAGVIGAIVALVLAGLIFAICFFLLGCRMQRVARGRRSELGGFKGAEKLASDRDLTIPKGADGVATVVVQPTEEPMSPVGGSRGHERVGSWELREQQLQQQKDVGLQQGLGSGKGMGRRPSYEDDDDEINVNPFSRGVRPDERV